MGDASDFVVENADGSTQTLSVTKQAEMIAEKGNALVKETLSLWTKVAIVAASVLTLEVAGLGYWYYKACWCSKSESTSGGHVASYPVEVPVGLAYKPNDYTGYHRKLVSLKKLCQTQSK